MNENITFCRMLLSSIGDEVNAAGYRVNKDAWIYHYTTFRGHYEFHGPNGYFDGAIKASNAYEARYIGWMRFLAAQEEADLLDSSFMRM